MVVKSQVKFIKSLQQKKYRNLHGLFVVEGVKMVTELLTSRIKPHSIYSTNIDLINSKEHTVEHITEPELKKISSLQNPNKVLAIFNIPKPLKINFDNWVVALDDVRDPGNLGTIIRLCDWFGISHLLCSEHTVDCYNPKVLQATMGSISRVNIVYDDMEPILSTTNVPIYGAFMEGEIVYKENLPKKGILVMGNEANGVSQEIETLIAKKISIPQYGKKSTESLNVATATAILLNEIRRV